MSTPGQGSILGSPIIYGKVDYGPTFGQVYRPVNQKRVARVAGTDTIQPFDQTVIYNKTVPAAFSVHLPDLDLWMTQPYGGFDLALIDGASNAGTYTITVIPFGSQTVDGQSSTSISTDDGSLILVPLVDRTGWEILSKTGSGGGGGTTPHLPFNSVQFNDAGAFGGNSGFTYDITTALTLELTQADDTSNGGIIDLTAGDGGATSGNGGAITITSGNGVAGDGSGGNITLVPGSKNGAGTAGHVKVTTLENFTTDALALAGGVPVTGLYRNGNEVRVNSAADNEGGSIDIVIDGAGVVLTTGLKGYLPGAPFAMILTQATLTANAVGSVVVNIWKCTYAQFDAGATHPVSGDKITASAPPTISAATKSQDSTLTGWTKAIAAGDILAFNIDSITTIQQVGLSLKYTKA